MSSAVEQVETLKGLLERANLQQHILKTIRVGLPRVDPKAAETVAQTVALKVRIALLDEMKLALLTQEKPDGP